VRVSYSRFLIYGTMGRVRPKRNLRFVNNIKCAFNTTLPTRHVIFGERVARCFVWTDVEVCPRIVSRNIIYIYTHSWNARRRNGRFEIDKNEWPKFCHVSHDMHDLHLWTQPINILSCAYDVSIVQSIKIPAENLDL